MNTAPVAMPAAAVSGYSAAVPPVATGCVAAAVLLDVGVVGVGGATVVVMVVVVVGGERVRLSSDISATSCTLSVSPCGRAVRDDADAEADADGAREKRGAPRSGSGDGGRR